MKIRYPDGDKWELLELTRNSVNYKTTFLFDFSFIQSNSMKDFVKLYVWNSWKSGDRNLNGLYRTLSGLKVFIEFSIIYDINSFREMTNEHVDYYLTYLNTKISNKTEKKLSKKTKKSYLDALKSLISFGSMYLPNLVPEKSIFTGNEYRGINKKISTDFIPDDVVSWIQRALNEESNIYVKNAIIILKETGMRISELLLLKVHYIQKHPIQGWELIWLDSKKQILRKPTPINIECLKAFRQLVKYTSVLRNEAKEELKEFLFLYKPEIYFESTSDEIRVLPKRTLQTYLKNFTKKHKIIDSNGEFFNLTAHQFRRTLATDMISKGIELQAVKDLLGHTNAKVTWQHYADVKDPDRAQIFNGIGIIGNIEKVDSTLIQDKAELEWFHNNKNTKARLSDGYCMKPFEGDEICSTFIKRQKCFGCNRFITTPEYLGELKNYLIDIQKEVEENVIYGEHYSKHFSSTIFYLKEIIQKLEELNNGGE